MKKFEVGMKVLCIKNHSSGRYCKRGIEYTIDKIRTCNGNRYDFVLKELVLLPGECSQCSMCKIIDENNMWLAAELFIPAEEFKQVTYTKIIEEIPMGVN